MVLAIEEPELYQHPARSRAIAKILADLAFAKGKGLRFQVFFTTHSPYFVNLDRFECLRRVEKSPVTGAPMETKIRRTSLKEVGDAVLKALGKKVEATEASSWARLKSVLGIRGSEGFFADGVILVEGQEDEAVLAAYAESRGISLDHESLAVIPTEGKTKIPSLMALYSQLGIPVFVVFDADGDKTSDADAHTDYNQAIMRLIGEKPEARPNTSILKSGAAWKTTFLDEVIAGFGEDNWRKAFKASCEEYAIDADQGRKKYAVVRRAVELLLASQQNCAVLDSLWKAISARFGLEAPALPTAAAVPAAAS